MNHRTLPNKVGSKVPCIRCRHWHLHSDQLRCVPCINTPRMVHSMDPVQCSYSPPVCIASLYIVPTYYRYVVLGPLCHVNHDVFTFRIHSTYNCFHRQLVHLLQSDADSRKTNHSNSNTSLVPEGLGSRNNNSDAANSNAAPVTATTPLLHEI